MSPFSSTLPKSPKFASNAPVNRLEPIAFPRERPFGCSYSKSGAYGPMLNDEELDVIAHFHSC